ncbi:MAG TPA: peptidoglycan editing factor PgeF [Vicinamibacterales bacterium]|nr:peptidoglycan editing factor PgeF [Vicinamibacterales bacterium]
MERPDPASAVPPAVGDDFEWRATSAGPTLVCRPLEGSAPHIFTTRDWRLGTSAAVDRDGGWGDVASAMLADPAHLARAHQVHGHAVVVRRPGDADSGSAELPDADILISNDPATAIAIQTADCVPLLLADRRTGAVAAAHAGWRGLAAGVPGVAVRAMREAFGTRPSDIVAAIGPSISAEHYEVDAAVRSAFDAAGASGPPLGAWFLAGRRPDRWQFDGGRSAVDQLENAGVPRARIHVAGLCTFAHLRLCSYRRDGKGAGRMAAAIRARG